MSSETEATPWWRALTRGDRRALWFFLLAPLVLFGVPTVLGHPPLAGDNLIQNYPLRVLVGEIIRTGHLPLMNPLSDSGTPLLGGMNAGAFFPLTFLFVVLPGLVAWVVNLALVYTAAGVGAYALARWHRLAPSSAFLAGLVFAFTGAMAGQMVHLGVIQGFALLPWLVLALLSLGREWRLNASATWRQRLRAIAPGTLGLTVLWGLIGLTGEPRAIAEFELVSVIVVPVVLLVRSSYQPDTWRHRLEYLVTVLVALGWGFVIAMGQLLPGWKFIAQSQRASISYAFFGSGSLTPRWSVLLFMQNVVGGNGVLHQASYFNSYNLPEVTVYATIAALAASVAFATNLTRRGWRGAQRDYVVYAVLIIIGLFATWGSYLPTGHLFHALPMFGNTRLQSRNIVTANLAAATLLAWWLEAVRAGEWRRAGLTRWRRWLVALPALVSAVVAVALLADGPALARFFGVAAQRAALADTLRVSGVVQLAIALGVVLTILLARRRGATRTWRTLVVVIVADVVCFFVFNATGLSAGHANPEPSRASAVSQLGRVGRFALIDPTGQLGDRFDDLGQPNMNVFTKMPSVQGYGSLIASLYGRVTDTHPLYTLNACALARGGFGQLRLGGLAIGSAELMAPIGPHAVLPPDSCGSARTVATDARYFGELLDVGTLELVGVDQRPVTSGELAVQLLNAHGDKVGVPVTAVGSRDVTVRFPVGARAAGFVVGAPRGVTIDAMRLTTVGVGASTYQLDSGYDVALATRDWQLTSTNQGLATFRARFVRPSMWLGRDAGSSTLRDIRNVSWGDAWVHVHATHLTIVKRSFQWIPGWRVSAYNTVTHQTVSLRVRRAGLIQQVDVPRGSWVLHFHYHAPYIELALVGSAVGSLGFAGTLWWYVRDQRQRTR